MSPATTCERRGKPEQDGLGTQRKGEDEGGRKMISQFYARPHPALSPEEKVLRHSALGVTEAAAFIALQLKTEAAK